MYEAFYGLKERPFNLTPDPRYLYLSEKHKEAFAHLLYGIKHRAGFVMVTGEIGTGKTTICRTLLNQLDPDTEVAFIFNPSLSPVELLKKINEDFGIESRAKTVKDLIDELNDYLLDANARGKNCVLVIDEAQNLTPSVLEQIRLLSNLESETQKLLQIVLIGQPELGEHLELRELRQLKQRITARYHLKALDSKESSQYVTYRLRVAGAHRRIRFTPSALRVIYANSKGTPRVINSLCDRALLIGYTQEVSEISKEIAQRAAKELRGEPVKKRRDYAAFKQFVPNPTIVAVAILAMIAGKYVVDNLDQITTPRVVDPGSIETSTNVAEAGAGAVSLAPKIIDTAAATVLVPPSLPEIPVAEKPLDFAGMLDTLDLNEARIEAARAILGTWDIEDPASLPQSDDIESLTAFAEANGFRAETLAPSLSQLTAINLPAFVRVSHGDRQMWLAVVGSTDDAVQITTTDGLTMDVPIFQFMERYLAEAVILWKDPEPDAPVLVKEMSGEPVRILQSQLKHLGLLEGRPTGYFGSQTVKAVADLQRETGLAPDGIAGRMTRMVLASWMPGFDTPSLNPDSKRIVASIDQAGLPVAPPKAVSALEPDAMDEEDSLANLANAVAPQPNPATEPEANADAAESAAIETSTPVIEVPPAEKPIAEAPAPAPAKQPAEPIPAPEKAEPRESAQTPAAGGPEIPVESFHEWFESVGTQSEPNPQAVSEQELPAPGAPAEGAVQDGAAAPNSEKRDVNEGDFEASSIMPLVPHQRGADSKPSDDATQKDAAGAK